MRVVIMIVLGVCCGRGFAQFGTNLVVNSSFEGIVPSDSGAVSVQGAGDDPSFSADLVGWDVLAGTLSLDRYDGAYGPATGTPPNAGAYYLFGDFGPRSAIAQEVGLGFAAASIDSGNARYELEVLLGSYVGGTHPESQDDIATVFLTFLDGVGAALDEVSVRGPSTPEDVGLPPVNSANFQHPFARGGLVPAGCRSVLVTLELVRDDDVIPTGFNNANADNLEFSIVERCPADLDGNGVLNFDDLDAFVASFLAGCP